MRAPPGYQGADGGGAGTWGQATRALWMEPMAGSLAEAIAPKPPSGARAEVGGTTAWWVRGEVAVVWVEGPSPEPRRWW